MSSIENVQNYWNRRPCNIKHSTEQEYNLKFFEEVEKRRYFVEPHILNFANFTEWSQKKVLEIGCGDAFATRIVQQTVKKVTVTDFDPIFIEEIHNRHQQKWGLDAHVHNMVLEPTKQSFDGIFSLDVLEHVQQSDEDTFLRNTCLSLNSHGALIIGMPSLESQPYASEGSKIGHVNCKTGTDLRDLMKKYFHSVFMFSMNDEVVHTGFFPMAHYLFAVCCDNK